MDRASLPPQVVISSGQMDVLGEVGGALARAELRKKYRDAKRPTMHLLPSRAPPKLPRVGAGRPPTAAASAWWVYALRCVIGDCRKERGEVDWAAVAAKKRREDEYMSVLTQEYARRLSTAPQETGRGGGGTVGLLKQASHWSRCPSLFWNEKGAWRAGAGAENRDGGRPRICRTRANAPKTRL